MLVLVTSTILARFYEPVAERILVGGIDVRDLTLESLRRVTGIVFEDTLLFATILGENIAFGAESSTPEAIERAAREANAWEFIEALLMGLDTPVGQRGVQLSEDQKHRIAVAPALLRDPRILILDEPTSVLDARCKHLLQQAMTRLMHGRTTFVIAHRLATVRSADRILVLDGGKIVGSGSHTELLAQHTLYRELHQLQFGKRVPVAPSSGHSYVSGWKCWHCAMRLGSPAAWRRRTAHCGEDGAQPSMHPARTSLIARPHALHPRRVTPSYSLCADSAEMMASAASGATETSRATGAGTLASGAAPRF